MADLDWLYESTQGKWDTRVYSQDDVAKILGVSRATVQAEEQRILEKLREAFCLDGTGYEWLIDRRERAAGIL